jgi:hypothetical protein
MIRQSNQLIRKIIYIAVIIWLMSATSSANASPPACHRNDVSMYMESDAVFEAVVTKSRRWSEGTITLHLVAKYKVLEVFKGDVDKDDILIVTDTCLDKPVPRQMLGYPGVEDYCRGGIGLNLTGINSGDGKPVMKSGKKPRWILFLRKNIRRGAPQLTWLEVSRTSFYGGCRQTRDDIPLEQREGFHRLFQRLKIIGN